MRLHLSLHITDDEARQFLAAEGIQMDHCDVRSGITVKSTAAKVLVNHNAKLGYIEWRLEE